MLPRVPQLPPVRFTDRNGAESNHVFLWVTTPEPPFMIAAPGWRIVGYGKAPWSKPGCELAVMFERTDPPSSDCGNIHGDECEVGTRIWQHTHTEWIPGHPDYVKRLTLYKHE